MPSGSGRTPAARSAAEPIASRVLSDGGIGSGAMSDADAKRGGIDLGGTKIEAIVVDADNQVLGQARRPTPTDGGPEDVAKQMAEALTEAANGCQARRRRR